MGFAFLNLYHYHFLPSIFFYSSSNSQNL